MKPTRSRTKRPRAYAKHGLYAAATALSRRGLSGLDGRSALARSVRDWRAAVASDLGGLETLSQAQRTLLDVAAQDVVLLSVADVWLKQHADQIVNRRRRSLAPIVIERLKVAAHLVDTLKLLGLERVARPVPALSDYMARTRTAQERTGEGETAPASSEDAGTRRDGTQAAGGAA